MDDCTHLQPFARSYLTLAIENGAAFFIVYHASNALDRREEKRNPAATTKTTYEMQSHNSDENDERFNEQAIKFAAFSYTLLGMYFLFSVSNHCYIWHQTASQCAIKRMREKKQPHIECMTRVLA